MLRSAHGAGASALVRVEVAPVDELPRGVQAPEQVPSTGERRGDGTWTPGASTDQRSGGRARAGSTRLARRLGLSALPDDAAFAPYRRAAADFRRAHCTALSRSVGGGHCGPGPSSIVASAAWQLGASRFLFDAGSAAGDASLLVQASRLADASRQNLLAAHELCAREAKARPQRIEDDPWVVDVPDVDPADVPPEEVDNSDE